MKKSKKCKNCNLGIVDGGANKRIQREIVCLKLNRNEKLKHIKAKTKEEKEQLAAQITNNTQEKIFILEKQAENVPLSKCCYCHGTGRY